MKREDTMEINEYELKSAVKNAVREVISAKNYEPHPEKKEVIIYKQNNGFKVVYIISRWSSLMKEYNNTTYSSEILKTIEEAKSISKNVWGESNPKIKY
jgi:hypothetical protein